MRNKYICLDIGGTKVLGVIFDENKNIVYRIKKKTKAEEGSGKIEEKIIKVVDELITTSGIQINDIVAIGAGAPGVINENTGEIIYTPNLPWRNYNIRSVIESKFQVPFYVGNDVKVGVLGEWKFGAGVGRRNIIGIFVGTGVGGGIIVENRLFTGSYHAAGELGHIVLNTEGPYCNCGQRGCLEAYAGKIGMTKEIRAEVARGRKTILKDLMDPNMTLLKSKTMKKAVDENDELAIEIMDRAIYYLAAGAGSFVNIFDPDMVILGGGVIEAMGDYIMPRFKKQIRRFALPDVLQNTELVQSALGDDAVVYGALALVTNKSF
ncbi:MAG: ROK family protein [Clostridia bacterium]|nr:ROK family protein [Clostridia bacterium]